MTENIRFCLKNVLRKRLRTFLTALAVAIGVCSVIIVQSAGDMGTDIVNGELDSLGLGGLIVTCVNQEGTNDKLTDNELEIIEKCEGTEASMPVSVSVSEVSLRDKSTECMLWGINEKAADIISFKIRYGRMFKKSDMISGSRVCMVDSSIANTAYGRTNIVGKSIDVNVNGSLTEYKVIGIVDAESSIFQNVVSDYMFGFVYLPIGQVGDCYDRIAVKIGDNNNVEQVGKTIENSLNGINGQMVYEAQNLAKQRNSLNRILNTVTSVLSAIGAISLFVAGITILTAMTMSVSEQTGEIGIKKALGASNFRIMGEVIFESLFISSAGCIFGTSVSLLTLYGVCRYFKYDFAPDFIEILGVMFFTVILGVIFSVIPAVKAARLNPVEALRRD